jgi:hypothetical protein
MSDTKPQNDRTVMYLLGVVAVLLVVIVAIIVVKSQGSSVPTVDTATQNPASAGTTSGALPGVGASAGSTFDPKTATKVPSGTTPEQFVKAYYQAILDKKWDVAFKMQPAASQANGTAKDFQSTQTSYGMKSFKVVSANVSGDTATVAIEQNLGANGLWGATWTLVKSGDTWYVKERQVTMK